MAKSIDLSRMKEEPLIVKLSNEEEFIIPAKLPTFEGLEIQNKLSKMNNLTDYKDIFEKSLDIIVNILNLDRTKNIDYAYVKENILYIEEVQAIIEGVLEHFKIKKQ